MLTVAKQQMKLTTADTGDTEKEEARIQDPETSSSPTSVFSVSSVVKFRKIVMGS